MKTMTLMAALAMLAATHSIATRTAIARDLAKRPAQTIRTFDLPAVKVYATVESSDATASVEPRIHDLPTVRVHAPREAAQDRTRVVAYRAGARRESLGIPRGGVRRGIAPERTSRPRIEERGDRWVALGCLIRVRLARVWPTHHCSSGGANAAARMPQARVSLTASTLGRRR